MNIIKRIKAARFAYKFWTGDLLHCGEYDPGREEIQIKRFLEEDWDSQYETERGKYLGKMSSLRRIEHNFKIEDKYRKHPKWHYFLQSLRYLWSPWWEEWDFTNREAYDSLKKNKSSNPEL